MFSSLSLGGREEVIGRSKKVVSSCVRGYDVGNEDKVGVSV